ncbi:MAG: BlaI/MecI/CopY family transcriptional regulator [Lachnospiraceae bacterium]|nr:BlaI/MecI/CopY family transcriptional regulator [Lachnospiraceae bacterium]
MASNTNRNKINKPSSSERKIMEFLWNEKDGLSFSEITSLLNQDNNKVLVKQTINTFLTRMIAKNLITKKTGDTRFKTRYYSKYTKEEYNRKVCEDILHKEYGDSFLEFVKQLSGGEYLSKEDAQKILEILEKRNN